MSRRIFIAVNPIQKIKEKIFNYQEICPDLPVRWTQKKNLHITVSFLGKVKDKALSKIIEKTRKTAKKHTPFFITLNKMCYGPPNKKPGMVWMTGKKSKQLGSLKADLEKELFNLSNRRVSAYRRGFSPHVTLGRLRRKKFNRLRPEERPNIARKVFIKFEVVSIDIMESELKRGGARYTILQTVNLGKF